jgi:hypothetical protein
VTPLPRKIKKNGLWLAFSLLGVMFVAIGIAGPSWIFPPGIHLSAFQFFLICLIPVGFGLAIMFLKAAESRRRYVQGMSVARDSKEDKAETGRGVATPRRGGNTMMRKLLPVFILTAVTCVVTLTPSGEIVRAADFQFDNSSYDAGAQKEQSQHTDMRLEHADVPVYPEIARTARITGTAGGPPLTTARFCS